jgi:hypothetical protein
VDLIQRKVIGAMSAAAFLAVSMLGLSAVDSAGAAHYQVKYGTYSAYDFRTNGSSITRIRLNSPTTCADEGSFSAVGIALGRPESGPIRVHIRRNGKFNFVWKSNNRFGWSVVKLRGRVLENRIRGSWSYVAFSDSYDIDPTTCWTGRSRDNPWVRFSAKRVRHPDGRA